MTSNLEFKNSDRLWPVAARLGNTELYFNEDWRDEAVNESLGRVRANRFLDLVFISLGVFGVAALALHIFAPVLNYWLEIFILTVFTDLILWTRSLKSRSANPGDVAKYFSPEAIRILRLSLMARDQKQASLNHLLVELLKNRNIQSMFYRLGVGFRQLAAAVLPTLSEVPPTPPALSSEFSRIPFIAYEIAKEVGSKEITSEVLLTALAHVSKEGSIGAIFSELALTPEDFMGVLKWEVTLHKINSQRSELRGSIFKPKGEINRSLTSVPTPILDRFSTDLTLRAALGNLPVIVGRKKEVSELLSVFNSDKPVLLVGEPGVGKTSLIELLAQKMLTEDVPPQLFDKRLVRLEFAQLVGQGAKAGEALTTCVNEALRAGNIVFVIEKIDQFAEALVSGVSLLSVITSALNERAIPVVATTTPQKFESIESLQSSFDRLDISELSGDDAVLLASVEASILESKNLFFTYEAVKEAVKLSSRYIQTGKQPQKTVKVLEACAAKLSSGKEITVVAPEDIERTVSEMSHVDVETVGEGEAEKLLHLEESLHKKIIGQEPAVKAVSNAMRRVKAKLTGAPVRPLASFLFVGPTGVGKTELARALAEIEFGSSENILRLDMSEYNLSESVERLLGGRTYVSTFVSQVREKPYTVLLLDEFEKAHPEIQNIFLQVLDTGHLTDNAGTKVDLTNTVVIATSNAAAAEIRNGFEQKLGYDVLQEKLAHDILPKFFKPELINRFDAVILFKPLELSHVMEVVKLQMKSLSEKLQEQGISLQTTDEGIEKIAHEAYDPVFGARPLRRYIQDNIENKLASFLLAKQLERRDTVVLGANAELSVKKA